MSYETFWHLNPTKLKPFYKAFKIRRKIHDEEMWMMGMYTVNAVSVSIANSFSKKAKAKYIEKPLMDINNTEKALSEKELQQQRELFVARLMAMKTNFELSKENK